jgi:hypothetical protein
MTGTGTLSNTITLPGPTVRSTIAGGDDTPAGAVPPPQLAGAPDLVKGGGAGIDTEACEDLPGGGDDEVGAGAGEDTRGAEPDEEKTWPLGEVGTCVAADVGAEPNACGALPAEDLEPVDTELTLDPPPPRSTATRIAPMAAPT